MNNTFFKSFIFIFVAGVYFINVDSSSGKNTVCKGSIAVSSIYDEQETIRILTQEVFPELHKCGGVIFHIEINPNTTSSIKNTQITEDQYDEQNPDIGLAYQVNISEDQKQLYGMKYGNDISRSSIQLGAKTQQLVVNCINQFATSKQLRANAFSNAECDIK